MRINSGWSGGVRRCAARAALIALLCCVVAGCRRKQQPFVPPPPPEVEVAAPESRRIPETLDFIGTTRGIESIEVRARVRGFIEQKHAIDGSRVKAGDLLYTIDPRPFEAEVRSARAQVDAARATLRLAEITLQRVSEAFKANAVAQLEVDRASSERDAARAAVDLSEARRVSAELDLEFTQVKSPITGRIGILPIEIGQLVGASEPTLLATVINDSQIYATYFMSERDLLEQRRINQNRRPGEDGRPTLRVLLGLANETGYPHEGSFKWGDNTVDPQTGTARLEAVFENKTGTLLPGLFVRLRSVLGERDAILVPDVAVQRDQMGAFLLIVNDESKVERRNVAVGKTVDRLRELLPGEDGKLSILPTDRIIVNGLQRARPGGPVKPVAAASAARTPKPAADADPAPQAPSETAAPPSKGNG